VGGTTNTDNQVFCYDEQNRLVWAGSTGTPTCPRAFVPGSLSSAYYTQTFSYDTLNRLTSGPLGSYSYGDTAHLHAATSIGTNTYTATYDAGGNMTCRAPVNPYACTGTPTGAQLSYDNEGRLSAWQNTPSSPTTTASYLYDGAGQRVQQAVTVNGSITTTTTYIAGGLEESVSNGAGTTLTKYFAAGGVPTMERVGTSGPVSVLASDGQGTVAESLDSTGTVTSAQLYTPYGVSRYSSGSSPTSHGYTGQVADSSTGLDYYNARYYDPVAGQFTSADTVADGLNRYGYVAGNPTTATDPSGHRLCYGDDAHSCVPDPKGIKGGGGCTKTTCKCEKNHTCGGHSGGGGGGAGHGGGGSSGSFGGCGPISGSSGGFAALRFAALLSSDCGGLSADQFQQLYDEAQRQGLNLTESDIEEMLNANPDLPYYQYELLVQLWGEGIRAYNVVEIAYAENGRLVWLDRAQLQHIIDNHWDDFRDYFSIRVEGVPVVDVTGTIFEFLMNDRPEGVNGDTYSYGFWDSLFDRFRGVEDTFDIVVNYQGRIITAYVPTPK
jgi:RHS repeat-associated protein